MFLGVLHKIAAWLTVAGIAALAVGIECSALQPATPLNRLGRQTWTMENGLPQNTVPVLLQSHSGFLWAGTELGLVRFDGVSFRTFDHGTNPAFPDAEVRCLLDGRGDGTLWVGTSDGLVRLQNGSSTLLTTRDGLPNNSIRAIAQTADGTIWAWTEAGLARLMGSRFEAVSRTNVMGGVTSIAADSAEGLWVGTTTGSARFSGGAWHAGPDADGPQAGNARGNDQSALVNTVANGDVLIAGGSGVSLEHGGAVTPVLSKSELPADSLSFLERLSDGTLAVASKSSVILVQAGSPNGHVVRRFSVSKELPGSRIEAIFADREGCLWVGTNRGLARITPEPASGFAVQLLPATDPLSSNSVISLLEDREGDLWVGTESAGLHILRDARLRVIGASDGLSSDNTTAVVQDSRQTLWIGTRDAGLNRITTGPNGKLTVTVLTTENGLLSNVILSLAVSADGDVWVGTPDGLSRISRSGIKSYTSADGLPDDFIRSLLVAADASVWIGTRRGLTHLEHDRFVNYGQSDGLGSDLVGALARGAHGDLWIATLNGLSRMHQGRLSNYTTLNGLSSNVITALDLSPDGLLWIGTQSDGLNLWDGKRFLPVRGNSSDGINRGMRQLPGAIHSVIHDDAGYLWIGSDTGLTRVDLRAAVDCAKQQSCRLDAASVSSFTTADGLRSRDTTNNSHPTACHASDGTLWFTTPRGVAEVDPLHFPANPGAPPVAIERFAVDDRDVDAAQLARITAGALRFQFDYAGLSFAAPQKLRYQYMLENFDRAWTDAGARRTAYYTNIPPGKYRFRVRATIGDAGFSAAQESSGNSAGPVSDATYDTSDEASLSFVLLPRFYQTAWFRALMALLIVAVVVVIFRRRVLRVEREFRAVMAERSRIAREIHDTLAQGYVGISLQLEILGELLRHNRADAAARHLTSTQELVREGLDDARQSIWALRSQDSGETTLPIRLRRLVEKAGNHDMSADLEVHGAYRALAPDVEQEILRVAQEAIHNVKKHAQASSLNVRLEYDERALALTIADDGKGFEAGSGPHDSGGHYGLTGMRERAALIHAGIEIVSELGKGTTVTLSARIPEARGRTTDPEDTGRQR